MEAGVSVCKHIQIPHYKRTVGPKALHEYNGNLIWGLVNWKMDLRQ